jgi:hypothetical protein
MHSVQKVIVMKKTTKKYINPTNRDTLFLRTVELFLIQSGCMSEDKLKQFRRNTSVGILLILKEYLEDCSNNSNHKMLNRYQKNSITLRLINEEHALSNQ